MIFHHDMAEEALLHCDMALKLSPNDTYTGPTLMRFANAHLMLGNLEIAYEYTRKGLRYPLVQYWGHVLHLSLVGHLELENEFESARARVFDRKPDFTLKYCSENWPGGSNKWVDKIVAGLRKAGVPEK